MAARDELFSQVPQTLLKPERQTILGDQHTSLGWFILLFVVVVAGIVCLYVYHIVYIYW